MTKPNMSHHESSAFKKRVKQQILNAPDEDVYEKAIYKILEAPVTIPEKKRKINRDYSYEEYELLTPEKRERFEYLMGLYFRKKI